MVIASEVITVDWNLNLSLGKPYSLAFSKSFETVSLAFLSFCNSCLTGLLALRFLSLAFLNLKTYSTHCLYVFNSQTHMYVGVYFWVYMYVSIHVCIFVYEHAYIYCVNVCIGVWIYVYMGMCRYFPVWKCVYVMICVCLSL